MFTKVLVLSLLVLCFAGCQKITREVGLKEEYSIEENDQPQYTVEFEPNRSPAQKK